MPRDDDSAPLDGAGLTLVTLGGLALYARRPDGTAEQLLGPGKHSALLAYLSLSSRRSATRDQLVDLLWADLDPHDARHALRQALWYLRQRAGEDVVRTENGDLVLGKPLSLDRDRFLDALGRGALEEAVDLYRGEFLSGFAAPGGAEFEHWADVERYRLRLAFAEAAETLARKQLSQGRFREAQRTARRLRDFTPQRQRSWRVLLEALLSAGDQAQAFGEAQALRRMLEVDGREPDPATTQILRRAQLPVPDGRQDAGGTEKHRPRLLNPELVGREAPFAAILHAWDTARSRMPRHVHVSAPAGLGKTRLLADVVSRLRAGGARLVSTRAHQAELQTGLAVASDLAARLAALPGSAAVSAATAAVLVGMNPTLSGRFDVVPDRSTGDEALRRRTFAMQELVEAVADEAPVALFIDDLHWIDAPSVRVLQALIARLERERVLVVTASRSATAAGVSRPDTIEIGLQPLDVAHVGQLVSSIGSLPGGEAWSERLPGALQAAASGSPLLVLESLQLSLERGTLALDESTWHAPDPDQLFADLAAGGTLRHRIEQLDRAARWVLQLLALAGIPLTAEQIARAAPEQADDLPASLEALERRGFLARTGAAYQPAHDQMTELALEAMPDAARNAAHMALGRALAPATAATPGLLRHAGRHLAAAGELEGAAAIFEAWARRLRARGDRRGLTALAADFLGVAVGGAEIRNVVRQLPAHVRVGFMRRRAIFAAAAGTLLVLVASAAAVLSRKPETPAHTLYVVGPVSADEPRVAAIAIEPETWIDNSPIDVARDGRRLDIRFPGTPPTDVPVVEPGGTRWAATRVFADSGAEDLVLIEEGKAQRLTFGPGDDNAPSWSPDGRQIAFQTTRWHPLSWSAIAIKDLRSGTVRPLARSDSSYDTPKWSPDGTRIAYHRRDRASSATEICWATVDAGREWCRDGTSGRWQRQLLGWVDDHTLLLVAAAEDSVSLRSYDVDVSAEEDIGYRLPRSRYVRAEVGGGWIAVESRRSRRSRWEWTVFPVRRPDLARALSTDTQGPEFAVRWGLGASVPGYLDSVTVTLPRDGIPLGTPFTVRVAGRDALGNPVAARAVQLRVADPTIAVVRPTGRLIPLRRGVTSLEVSAGGWRRVSVPLVVRDDPPLRVLAERWTPDFLDRWRLFGDPRPSLAIGPDSIPAFWNQGDGSYLSGAYSVGEFPTARGVGVGVLLSAPVDRAQWQELSVTLVTTDSAALARWNHETGYPPGFARGGGQLCGFEYPAGTTESRRALLRFPPLAAGNGVLPVSASVGSGRWTRAVLQLFPDGTCGVAVDGVPLGRSSEPVTYGDVVRVFLGLASRDNLMLHGPLDVWTGVTDEVDWFALLQEEAGGG